MIIKLFTLDGIRRKADRSISLNIGTVQEQSTEEMKELDGMFQSHILVAIKEEDRKFSDEELDNLEALDLDLYDTKKTFRYRLRSSLYVLLEKRNKKKPTAEEFKAFHDRYWEKAIQDVQDLIPD